MTTTPSSTPSENAEIQQEIELIKSVINNPNLTLSEGQRDRFTALFVAIKTTNILLQPRFLGIQDPWTKRIKLGNELRPNQFDEHDIRYIDMIDLMIGQARNAPKQILESVEYTGEAVFKILDK